MTAWGLVTDERLTAFSSGSLCAAATIWNRTRLVDGVQEQHRWLRAIDLVVAEVASEFGGEDPLAPQLRDILLCSFR